MKQIEPVAYIETPFADKFGVPRQSGRVPSALGKIVFYPKYKNDDYLRGIENFSHLWLLFDFSLVSDAEVHPTVRPPRLGGNTRVGVFATRSPFRPNGIGLSSVKLERVEKTSNGTVLVVSGVDLVNGTPIYDVKPYVSYTDCHTDAVCGFADEHSSHKLQVVFACENTLPPHLVQTVTGAIADDPRPSFQNDEKRIYGMRVENFDVRFTVQDGVANVVEIIAL